MVLRFLILFFFFILNSALGREVPFTLLFTGDLHSSFESRPHSLKLGGMARLKTAFNTLRKDAQAHARAVLQLDAGDCTEGAIYFNLGAGVASFEMLNRLGYDAIVVGNHDWYTGPYVLDKVLSRVPLNFSFLSANLNFKHLPEDNTLPQKIKRYEIFYGVEGGFLKKGQNGFSPEEGKEYFKIGVFGLSTNEPGHEPFFHPVQVNNPLVEAKKVVRHLRSTEMVDVVILVSHLLDEDDLSIAESNIPIDIIVGGHSHNKIIPNKNNQPIVITRESNQNIYYTTWLAKTGNFGKFLGQMDLVFDSTQKKMLWNQSKYVLHQIDHRYAEDSSIKNTIEEHKKELQKKYSEKNSYGKDIFNDHIADSEIDLVRSERSESYLGNLVVRAMYEKTKDLGVDFTINNSRFFSHGLPVGPIHSVDLYHVFTLIYDPLQDASWTIWTLDIHGKTLKKSIDLVFMLGHFFDVEGLEVIYDLNNFSKIHSILYKNQEIEDDKIYRIATTPGIVMALKLMKDQLPAPISNIQDTQIEIWDTLREYFKKYTPIRADNPNIRVSGRLRTIQPDMSVLSEDIVVRPVALENVNKLEILVDVYNLGYGGLLKEELAQAKTDPTELFLYYDSTPDDLVDDIDALSRVSDQFFFKKFHSWYPVLEEPPDHVRLIDKVLIPALGKDEKKTLSVKWDVSSLAASSFPYTIYAFIHQTSGTGFVDFPSEDPEGEIPPTRKMEKIEESNLHNNKARTYVYLKSLMLQRHPQ